MLGVLLAGILGVITTLLAIQNQQMATIQIFDFAINLPVYIIAAGTFVLGILLTMLLTLFDTTLNAFTLHNKDAKISQMQKVNENLSYKLAQLNNYNQELKSALHNAKVETRNQKVEHTKDNVKNFFGRIRQNLSI